MIVSAYLLALQAVPQEQAPPEIERPYLEAVATWFLCAKREIDTVPSRDRWRQSEQVVDAALAACTAEEAAYALAALNQKPNATFDLLHGGLRSPWPSHQTEDWDL